MLARLLIEIFALQNSQHQTRWPPRRPALDRLLLLRGHLCHPFCAPYQHGLLVVLQFSGSSVSSPSLHCANFARRNCALWSGLDDSFTLTQVRFGMVFRMEKRAVVFSWVMASLKIISVGRGLVSARN
jgi:hypothetical protein